MIELRRQKNKWLSFELARLWHASCWIRWTSDEGQWYSMQLWYLGLYIWLRVSDTLCIIFVFDCFKVTAALHKMELQWTATVRVFITLIYKKKKTCISLEECFCSRFNNISGYEMKTTDSLSFLFQVMVLVDTVDKQPKVFSGTPHHRATETHVSEWSSKQRANLWVLLNLCFHSPVLWLLEGNGGTAQNGAAMKGNGKPTLFGLLIALTGEMLQNGTWMPKWCNKKSL